MTDQNPHLTDPALSALADQIDRLAFSDGAADGLESRIFAATLPLIQQSPAQPTLRLVQTEGVSVVSRRRWFASTPMRIAAAFAIMATAGLTWLAMRPSIPAPTAPIAIAPEQVDEWAMMSSVFDDSTYNELDEIGLAASSLRDSLDALDTNDFLEEGAM